MLVKKRLISISLILLNFLFFSSTAFCQIFFNRGYRNYNNYNYNYNYNNNYTNQNRQSVQPTTQQPPVNVADLKKGVFYKFNFSTSGMFASSSEYKLMIPDNELNKGSYGLLVYLHGDEARDYYSSWIVNQLIPIAKEYNLILVSVLAPGMVKRWYVAPRYKADYLNKLITTDLVSKFDIDTNNVYFTGSSGGSQFLTGIFIAEYASNYGGGAFPTCGGANLFTGYQVKPKITEQMKQNFKLFYYTNTGDFLYSQVVASKRTYERLGLMVQGFHAAGGHCQFQMRDVAKRAFNFFFSENN